MAASGECFTKAKVNKHKIKDVAPRNSLKSCGIEDISAWEVPGSVSPGERESQGAWVPGSLSPMERESRGAGVLGSVSNGERESRGEFNTIQPHLLLQCLLDLQMNPNLVLWIRACLCDRPLRVGVRVDPLSVRTGGGSLSDCTVLPYRSVMSKHNWTHSR